MTRTEAALAEAERLLQAQYEPLKAEALRSLRAKLHARGVRGLDDDLDAYYNQAWHALYDQVAAGAQIANAGGFLVQVAFRRAIDDVRRLRPADRADLAEAEGVAAGGDPIARLDDQRRLRELIEALRAELDERERVAASLCYVHGYTRSEAARLMGIGERRMQKLMDRVSKVVSRVTGEIQSGGRCELRASLIKAYALGLLDEDGERYALAREHLEECARCRADVLRMRGLAVVAPAALLPWAAMQLAGGAGAGGVAAASARPRGWSAATMAAGGAAAVAVVVVAAVVALAALRDGGETPRAQATTPPAAAVAAATASPERRARAPRAQSAPPRRAERRPQAPAAAGATAPGPNAASPPAASGPAASGPSASGPSASGPARTDASAPAPVTPVPAPAPAPAPATLAPAAPEPAAEDEPVLDDGAQEFGIEP